jgi:hypothetical protein
LLETSVSINKIGGANLILGIQNLCSAHRFNISNISAKKSIGLKDIELTQNVDID